jgi:hypothetical protein
MILVRFCWANGDNTYMARSGRLDLTTFDGRLLDGLNFCRKVYAFFDQVKSSPAGIEKLRLLRSKEEKRLVEELIPIAQYVQARYDVGRRIKVRWHSGSQPFDAVLLCYGRRVENRSLPKKAFLEVTTAVHPNAHLMRELVNAGEVSFGVKGVSRDKHTRRIISKPHGHHEGELTRDLGKQILERLQDKRSKEYPPGTVLVINCVTNTRIDEAEWQAAIKEVRKAGLHSRFREVFLFDGLGSRSTTL